MKYLVKFFRFYKHYLTYTTNIVRIPIKKKVFTKITILYFFKFEIMSIPMEIYIEIFKHTIYVNQ